MALALASRRLFQRTPLPLQHFRSTGYVILLPEIGEDLQGKNPLLQPNGLPEFSNIAIENCIVTVGRQALEFQVSLRDLENKILAGEAKHIFSQILDPLEVLSVPLDITWGISKAIYLGNGTRMPTNSYLSIHQRAKRARAIKFYSEPIHQAVKNEINDSKWTEEQKRVLYKFQLEGKLNGLELMPEKRAQLSEILSKLQNAREEFKSRVEQSTRVYYQDVLDPSMVADFPIAVKQSISIEEKKFLQGPWRLSLKPQVYKCIMERCPDREQRWNAWRSMVMRSSAYGKSEFTTSTLLEQIREARFQQAKILGYETFVDMSMETKMAGSVTKVKEVMNHLLEYAKPAQETELAKLLAFASKRGFKGSQIELWDVPYWRRQHQLHSINFAAESIREYFPLTKVLQGLFTIVEEFFGLRLHERIGVSTWHKFVKYYDIIENGECIAGLYLDPHPASINDKLRVNENHGWMIAMRNKSRVNDHQPLACVVFNFELPDNNDQPVLLTFEDVRLLFSKFGHALQHLATRASYSEVAGSSGVEWDMVETCGHVFSQLLNRRSIIDLVSGHWETGHKLPEHIFNYLTNSNKLTAGIDLSRELYLSALDLELHSNKKFWLDIVRELWPKYRAFPLQKQDMHPCSFTAIFSDVWAAAYYSHLWAHMIAADVGSAFDETEDEQQFKNTGKRFRETFLALGGSCNPNEVFRKFRGRDPCPNALLRSLELL